MKESSFFHRMVSKIDREEPVREPFVPSGTDRFEEEVTYVPLTLSLLIMEKRP